MSEHGWTRHGHRCCDQATGPRPNRVARCGGPAICRECAADAAIRHSPGSGTFAVPTSPSEPVPSTPRVLGYVVATKGADGFWHDDWDGKVHADLATGRAALAECREFGCESTLALLTEVEETNDAD